MDRKMTKPTYDKIVDEVFMHDHSIEDIKDLTLSNLSDVDDTDKAEGKILKVDSDGNHVYVNDESGTDEKVKINEDDLLAGYLQDKLVAGSGVSITEGTGDGEGTLIVANTDKGSDITLPTRDSLGLDTDDTVTFANLSGTNTGDQDLTPYAKLTDEDQTIIAEQFISVADTSYDYDGDFVDTATIGTRVKTYNNDGTKYTSIEDDNYIWTLNYDINGKYIGRTVTTK
jgi:hypothetical protein